jgi:hypothetical protein
MSKIDFLRELLYRAIDNGDKEEILVVSQELDNEIVAYLKTAPSYLEQLRTL